MVDIREESCRVYEGHFSPYLRYSATGLAFVLQSFSAFVFFFCHCTCVCAHIPIHVCTMVSAVCVCVCPIAGSTWRPTPSPQAWCWWRRCQGIRWARSTRRTSCDSSSHDWTALICMTALRFLVQEVQV